MARKKVTSARKQSRATPPRAKTARATAVRAARPAAATALASAPVDKVLLRQAEALARARGTTVAALLAEGLRKVVGEAKVPVLPPGDMQPTTTSVDGPWGQLLAWMEEQQSTLTEIRNALGDVAASLPNDAPPDTGRAARETRIPPP
jgi:hypothetical protein